MKRLLLPLLAALALPTAVYANVDPEVHKLCLPAADYAGCVKTIKNKSNDEIRRVSSGSMAPTLMVDDLLKVNKIAYKRNPPKRGDVVLFNSPFVFDKKLLSMRNRPLPSKKECEKILEKDELDPVCNQYIKRIVGIGGDKVKVNNKGEVYLNGSLIKESYASKCKIPKDCWTIDTFIPKRHVIVLGDNRQESWDSRYWPDIFLPNNQIQGKVEKIIYPTARKKSF